MSYYHLAPDDDGARAIYYDDGLYGDDPLLIASRSAVSGTQWDLLLIGARLHDDHAVIPRETLADIAEDARVAAVDVDDDPANGVWAVRNLRDRLAGLVGEGQ